MLSFKSTVLTQTPESGLALRFCCWSEKDAEQMAEMPWQAIMDRALAGPGAMLNRIGQTKDTVNLPSGADEAALAAVRELCERIQKNPEPQWMRLSHEPEEGTSRYARDFPSDGNFSGYWLMIAAIIDELFESQTSASVVREYLKTALKRVLLDVHVSRAQHFTDYAFRDVVTACANRLATQLQLDTLLAQKHPFVLISADLDGFKAINDTYGHAAGDDVLNTVAQRWQRLMRQSDWLGRWGGDEFVMILSNPLSTEAVVRFGNRIRQTCEEPIVLPRFGAVQVSSSYGYARYPEEGQDMAQILSVADQRLYTMKRFLACGMDPAGADAGESVKWSDRIRRALETNRIDVYYQPILRSDVNVPFQWEALVRYRDRNGEVHYPAEFLPVLPSDVVQQMDQAVLRHVFEDLSRWRLQDHRWTVAINVDPASLSSARWQADLIRLHRDFPLVQSEDITFEIQESQRVESPHLLDAFYRMQQQGYQIALDDFGTGDSTLSRLQKMPLNTIKIDSTVTRQWHSDSGRRLIQSIIGLARPMGLAVVAEGVESAAQQNVLRQWGCEAGQGWFYSAAIPAGDVAGWTFGGDSGL
ncbi:MAG: bifunctional diguanylate cyclase/phosphodiesterase [Firmicutes bacterium]|jgi:diguanylate cyclase (GGDEF)-like protein|uniref:Diguanylate cyclase n=1 Tax=Sulfobacillus benefaciens TaxID=453960 RepID=A0A2T2X076_9FIRM|nr:bifunctional diguanylate cyclase/phosphodiesterase [Bacillota bacterium]MCL5014471.1 bifunctional diguanylate cyclase/phosphodiesterase [Bacillota bacterium]PSR27890.1 MAG: hypothetical protein C7B43_10920 [Sulfobacillus benefaciens]